jgi:alpha-1,3-rhamnosyl/mannosyltransferase
VKVILSVEALSTQLSGIGRYAWQLTSGLPTVLPQGSIRYHHQQRWVQEPSRLLNEPIEQALAARVKENPLPVRKKPWGLRRISKWLAKPKWVSKPNWRKQCRGAVFHGPNFFVPDYADKAVITVHDLSVFKFPETHPKERIAQFNRDFERSLAKATHIITDSEATRRELAAFTGLPEQRITAIALAAGTDYRPRAAEALQQCLSSYGLSYQQYVLCVSTLEPRKKIAVLVAAYRLLPVALRQRVPLVLVGGKGWLNDALHHEIDKATAEGWLKYLGFVAEADLPLLYAGASSFAYPSIYEGFGLPVLEAMASGVPVVASNRTSLPEVTQGMALHVEPDDIDELKEAILKSIEDNNWRTAIIPQALDVASCYSWDRCIRETVAVYHQVDA